jgi:hypothetical protein
MEWEHSGYDMGQTYILGEGFKYSWKV